MNYPFWEVPLIGGGLVIGLIAIIHVFISHFAVGGGLFLVLTERRAITDGDPALLAYAKSHSLFFLLLTVVLGAVSGVGIWFSIGLVHPDATSLLIRTFVWAWAIEWTFFLVEIVSILIYYATWERLDSLTHNVIGWIYFISAYLSLVVITAILSFMLTPGGWLESKSFWAGFLNPSYFPSVIVRTGAAVALAGLYAIFTASLLQDIGLRKKIVGNCSRWVMASIPFLIIGGIWYTLLIPRKSVEIATGGAPAVTLFTGLIVLLSLIIFTFAYLLGFHYPSSFTPPLALLFLILGFMVTGFTEWTREAVRKPYIIYDYMYSNTILKGELGDLQDRPLLETAKWASVHEVNEMNSLLAGRELFRLECQICHTVNGYNGIKPLISGWTEEDIYDALGKLDRLKTFMPPFVGSDDERKALAKWLSSLKR